MSSDSEETKKIIVDGSVLKDVLERLDILSGEIKYIKSINNDSLNKKRKYDEIESCSTSSDGSFVSDKTVIAESHTYEKLVSVNKGEVLTAKEFIANGDGYKVKKVPFQFNCDLEDMVKYKLKNKKYEFTLRRKKDSGQIFLKMELSFFGDKISFI